MKLTPDQEAIIDHVVAQGLASDAQHFVLDALRNQAYELETIAGIERGLDDMRAGRLVPHEHAMARIRATIEAAKTNP